jgi:predicted RNA-binding Zn ribbon-like protein
MLGEGSEYLAPDRRSRPAAFFVADHLALDFVNTRATPSGVWTDWLNDGEDLLAWLEQAGAIEPEAARRLRKQPGARRALDQVAHRARNLRGWLRPFVERHAGRPLTAEALAELGPLNRLLARDESYWRFEARRDSTCGPEAEKPVLRLRRVRRWTSPEQLLALIAEAIADLVCNADFRRIHVCEGTACTLMFLDKTKSHARRWCSMAICGNRAKAAAHRARAARTRE